MDTHIQFSNIKPFGFSVHAEVRREIPDYTEPNLVVNRPKRNPPNLRYCRSGKRFSEGKDGYCFNTDLMSSGERRYMREELDNRKNH